MLILISFATFCATLMGGLFALKFKDRLHLILGFSAGAVIGVAFFDLIPESIKLAGTIYDVSTVSAIVALGFVGYMVLDRLVVRHGHGDEHDHSGRRGILGAGSLSVHSFIDGVAVGLAFQVSSSVGLVVAVAVLVHDFSDGINTVSMIVKNGGGDRAAYRWLLADAIAPFLGITSTLLFSLPQSLLGVVLAVFAGFFLYIGASDLLPESHHAHPTSWTTVATVVGVFVLYVAIKLAGL